MTRFALRLPGRRSPRGAVEGRRPTARARRATGLVLLLALGQLLPAAATAADPTVAAPTPDAVAPRPAPDPETIPPAAPDAPEAPDGGVLPGIHHEDAAAHAADRIEFEPGGRVTVGFRPKLGDSWEVNGRSPRALPAGTASGTELRSERTGGPSVPTQTTPDAAGTGEAPVDAPTTDPSALPQADPASMLRPLAPESATLDGTRLRREVFGFLPYWEVSSAVLDYEVLSTIAYFSVGADKNGNLLKTNSDGTLTTGWGGWTSSRMTSIINGAHQKGTRVVLTISMFAWTSGQATTQAAFLGNPSARLNLARQAADAVRARGADGINLDFEPIVSGYDDEFTAFVRTVRAELNARAAGYQLTFDTTGYIGNYPLEAATAPGGADAVFIMGYDYRTASAGYAGSIDPLSGPAYDLADTVAAFSARIAPSKIILGIPWYGRAWSTVSDKVNAQTQSGTKYGTSSSVIYDTAVDYAAQYGRRWDTREQSPWVAYQRQNCSSTYGCVTSWRQIYYDDAASLKLRYDLINRKGLRGMGIWALGYDGTRPEMRQAIAEKFLNDRTAPLAGIRALDPAQATESFTVAWAGADESGIRDFDVQVSIDGSSYHDWLIDTTATSATYAGADGHGFAFRARARDTHGNVGPWDVMTVYRPGPTLAVGGFGRVVASSLNVRSGADTSASIVTTANAGTLLAITGGPASADGYTWWQVSLPIAEWSPIGGVTSDVWVAAGNSSTTFVEPAQAPNATSVDLPSGAGPAAGARFVAIDPVRLLDSRFGNGLSGVFTSGAARILQVTGRGGIPTNAVAVTGTITVVNQTSAGYLSIGPSSATVTASSVVNAPLGDVRGSGVTSSLATNGTLAIHWTGAGGSKTHVVFDATGYYVPGTTGATYLPLSPTRVLDTRFGTGLTGTFASDVPRTIRVAGAAGVPADAVAITGNLAAITPTSAGYLAAGPTVASNPATSSLNLPRGDIRAAAITVKLDGQGRIAAVWKGAAGSRTHLVLDVTGYFVNSGAGATYYPLDPARLVDTRFGNGLSGPFQRNVARTFQAAGRGTVPVDAVAVTGSVAVVTPTRSGWFNIGPSTTTIGGTSTLNIPAGDIRANGFAVRTGPGGTLAGLLAGGSGISAGVVVDVSGYFR